jgi:hypothetical protein
MLKEKFASFLSLLGLSEQSKIMEFLQDEKRRKASRMGHESTPPHGHRLRGHGFTRKDKEESKVKRKMAAKSRAINRRKK